MVKYRLAEYSLNVTDMKQYNWRWAEQGSIADFTDVPISDLSAECVARRVPEVGLFEQLKIAWDPTEPRMAVAGVVGLLGELVALSSFNHLRLPRYCVEHPKESSKKKSSDWLFSTYQDNTFLSVEVKAKGWQGANIGIGGIRKAFKQAGWGAEFDDNTVPFRRLVAYVRLCPKTSYASKRRKTTWNSERWDIALVGLDTKLAPVSSIRAFYPENLGELRDLDLAKRIGADDPVLGHGLACWLGKGFEFSNEPRLIEMLNMFGPTIEGGRNALSEAHYTNTRMSDAFAEGVSIRGHSYETALRQHSEPDELPEGSIRVDRFRVLIPVRG